MIPHTNAYAGLVPNATGLTAIVTVGDEILSGHTQDTNSSLLARLAFASGRPVSHIEVVGDQPEAIVAAIRRAIDDPEISRIAVCGGIGGQANTVVLLQPLDAPADGALGHAEAHGDLAIAHARAARQQLDDFAIEVVELRLGSCEVRPVEVVFDHVDRDGRCEAADTADLRDVHSAGNPSFVEP